MRRSSLIAALTALALVLGPAATRAAPITESCWCGHESPNAGKQIACDRDTGVEGIPREVMLCECWNECSGAAPAGGVNPAVAKATITVLGTLSFVMILSVAPGFALRLMGAPPLDRATFNEQWRKQLAELRAYEQRGVVIRRLGDDLATVERDAARDEANAADQMRRLGFNPPALKPSLAYLCDQAALALPYDLGGGSIAGFATVEEMVQACGPFDPPSASDSTCTQGGWSCGEACCPMENPIYNQCDQQCYRTSEFRGADTPEGQRCARYARCQARTP